MSEPKQDNKYQFVQIRPYSDLMAIAEGPVGTVMFAGRELNLFSANYLELAAVEQRLGINPVQAKGIMSLTLDQLAQVGWMALRGPRVTRPWKEGDSEEDAFLMLGQRMVTVPAGDDWSLSKEDFLEALPSHLLACKESVAVFLLHGLHLEVWRRSMAQAEDPVSNETSLVG